MTLQRLVSLFVVSAQLIVQLGITPHTFGQSPHDGIHSVVLGCTQTEMELVK